MSQLVVCESAVPAVSGGQGRLAQVATAGSPTVALPHTAGIDPDSSCDSPFVVLLKEDRADQPCDSVLVGKDADDVVAPLDPCMEAALVSDAEAEIVFPEEHRALATPTLGDLIRQAVEAYLSRS